MIDAESVQYFCEYCHRNFKLDRKRCPWCDSPEIVRTRGACHVAGCPFPQLDDVETCAGHTRPVSK